MSSDPAADCPVTSDAATLPVETSRGNEAQVINPLEKIEQLLTCPICLERYRSPKLLPCQHTFCLPCLDSYADVSQRNLKCPECRAEHPIDPYEGVKTFPTNFTLTAFLDIHLEATEHNAEDFQAYIQRYNLERCKICDEKAELEICPHCDRKTCVECRKTHMDSLKRDLGRLLTQVRRLSNRVKEASEGLNKGIDLLNLNGETTKAEVQEYFHRYYRELKRREEHFLTEVETFVQTEGRLMRTLRDVLHVENSNLQDACIWVEAVLSGSRVAKDEELSKTKAIFVEGLDYLRNFQPDSDDLFAKKLRFSPGDDAAKLPTAISNFGELTVSLPQFSNRYLPMEEQYLPKPFRMPLESDTFKYKKLNDADDSRPSSRYGAKMEDEGGSRYRRRQQLEEEAWGRLKTGNGAYETGKRSRCNSPRNLSDANAANPWTRPSVPSPNPDTEILQPSISPRPASPAQPETPTSSVATPNKIVKAKPTEPTPSATKPEKLCRTLSSSSSSKTPNKKESPKNPGSQTPGHSKPAPSGSKKQEPSPKPTSNSAVSKNLQAGGSQIDSKQQLLTAVPPATTQNHHHHKKPPLPRQNSSQEDKSLNEKVQNIRVAHEKRQQQRSGSIINHEEEEEEEEESTPHRSRPIHTSTQKFRIIRRSSSSRPANHSQPAKQEEKKVEESSIQIFPIPISHFPGNSTSSAPNWIVRRQQSFERSKTNPDMLESLAAFVKSNGSNPAAAGFPSARVQQLLNERSLGSLESRGRPLFRQDSTGESGTQSNTTTNTTSTSATDGDLESENGAAQKANGTVVQKRSRFRRRSSIVPDRELSTEEEEANAAASTATTVSGSLSRAVARRSLSRTSATTKRDINPIIDYASKQRPRLVFGHRGDQPGEMHWPRGVCSMPGGEFAVCDSSNHRIQVFDSNGRLLRTFGKYGSNDGEVDSPAGIAYNRYKHQLVVSDRYNHRIQIFDLNGKFVRQFGSRGSTSGKFNNPWGLALDELGLIYVADKDNHRVQVFDQNGNFMNKFGSHGEAVGQFNHPLFIAIHKRTQNLFVSDSANHRVCVFNHDCSPLLVFGVEGFQPGQLKLPRGVAVDEQGFVVVADSGNNRVQVFSPDGQSVRVFGAWGILPGQLKGVEGVAIVDTQIIVSDRENHRVQLF